MIQRICVYAGSKIGARPEYLDAARMLGEEIASRGWGLVYGGAQVGLMGEVANAVLARGGEVLGVIPEALFPIEVTHTGVTSLYKVKTIHERKALMASLADGFIALPGGLGTYEELFEMLAWGHLGLHQKPVALFNIAGYYDPLLALLKHTSQEGFAYTSYINIFTHDHPTSVLDSLANYIPPKSELKLEE